MAMTTLFTQNNDGSKVLVSVYDPNGKAYASFYLKPRMGNFIVSCTPQACRCFSVLRENTSTLAASHIGKPRGSAV